MKPSDFLSKEEIQAFTARSDLHGARVVFINWILIAATFAAVAVWTNPLTILLAIIVLGGRQLGIAVLMHEAGHKTLFKTHRLNDFIGQWFCAYPVLGDCDAYGASHREHHRTAGTEQDPDLPNYQNYPISKSSFMRKMKRDLSGQTGSKFLVGSLKGINNIVMRAGTGQEDNSAATQAPKNSLRRGLFTNAIILLLLASLGYAWLYLLWIAAYVITYPTLSRIRQVAEHGNVPDLFDLDPRQNTRTTIANPLERLVLCPNNVNYHLEHHLLASVPCYRLQAFHQRLKKNGFYDGHEHLLAHGYWDVLKRAVPELGGAPSTA